MPVPISQRPLLYALVRMPTTLQETTSTTLAFGFLYLLLDYDAQKRLQEELDSIVPHHEDVTLAHRSRLPYTNAVVNVRLHPTKI